MGIEEIQCLLEEALQELIEIDSHLLIHDLSEQSMTHRLALHLTPKFPEYDVDCEYNGDIDSDIHRKEIHILKEDAANLGLIDKEKFNDENTIAKRVFPDIIVHKRGLNTQNLLVIEAKKSTNTSNKAIRYDKSKLKKFTLKDPFDYSFGAYLEFVTGEENPDYNIRWFRNGKEFSTPSTKSSRLSRGGDKK